MRAAQTMNIATAAATSTSSTDIPIPAAAFSLTPKRTYSLIALSMMSGAGDTTHMKTASASFGASFFCCAR